MKKTFPTDAGSRRLAGGAAALVATGRAVCSRRKALAPKAAAAGRAFGGGSWLGEKIGGRYEDLGEKAGNYRSFFLGGETCEVVVDDRF